MAKSPSLAFYWLPPLAWMGLIFYFSSLSGLPDYGSFDLMVKKFAHFTVYAILYLLLFRAFHSIGARQSTVPGRIYIYPAAVGILFAVSDEIHQSFVPFRTATVRDVLIDSAGVLAMCLLVKKKPAIFRWLLRA